MRTKDFRQIVVAVGFMALLPAVAVAGPETPGPESRRMARAKDLIADEQWARAIEELRAAVADPNERNKDEALFWLAHSQNQENDFAAAVESIRRLEREHAPSRWVKPARSLLIELAQKLRRDDVLWWHAVPPPPPPRPLVKGAPTMPRAPTARRFPVPKPDETPTPPTAVTPAGVPPPAPPVPSTPPVAWVTETWSPDTDERILALGSLIHTNENRVIDMLRHIALEENPVAARRAVFVLAQSRKPQAQSAIVDVARRGPEPVRVAAVRELGRFGGPEVSEALVQVYYTAKAPVKRQVVNSLGERAETSALLRIAQSEGDQSLRASAIVTLGRAGGREQLFLLYAKADRESKRPIIIGLFTARGEEELIRIADTEKDEELRAQVLSRLRLLGTPKARAYLAKVSR